MSNKTITDYIKDFQQALISSVDNSKESVFVKSILSYDVNKDEDFKRFVVFIRKEMIPRIQPYVKCTNCKKIGVKCPECLSYYPRISERSERTASDKSYLIPSDTLAVNKTQMLESGSDLTIEPKVAMLEDTIYKLPSTCSTCSSCCLSVFNYLTKEGSIVDSSVFTAKDKRRCFNYILLFCSQLG